MPIPTHLPVFLLAALLLLLTPGPAVLYIIARSLDQGRLAGFVSVLSIETGNLVHVLAAALGLSVLLASAPAALVVVKYLGAAYLAYLGIRRLLERGLAAEAESARPVRLGRIYRQGVTVAVLNPKTALFFLAFLPQFVDVSKGSAALQLLTLGGLFVLMAVCTDSAYAFLASGLGRWLKGSPTFLRLERYVAGGIYIGLGVLAAIGV
jgi:threonine/homoserine/homoserine lactone efflux protein